MFLNDCVDKIYWLVSSLGQSLLDSSTTYISVVEHRQYRLNYGTIPMGWSFGSKLLLLSHMASSMDDGAYSELRLLPLLLSRQEYYIDCMILCLKTIQLPYVWKAECLTNNASMSFIPSSLDPLTTTWCCCRIFTSATFSLPKREPCYSKWSAKNGQNTVDL